MERLLVPVSGDLLVGLQALARVGGAADGDTESLEKAALLVLNQGLAAGLREVGLPWAPPPELVDERLRSPRSAGRPPIPTDTQVPRARSPLPSIRDNNLVRVVALVAAAVTTIVLLLGGYIGKWSWTGFESNGQVWDWLHLLLLPVAFGTLPLWLRFSEHMSRARKIALTLVIVAFVGFVIAGYLVPISWTGFSGNNLWDWLTLVVLPVALITVRAWPATRRQIRGAHIAVLSALSCAWIVTLIGGYAAAWLWTGYPGNTLWDWLQLLLAPLVVTTVVVPAAVRWVSGDVVRIAVAAEREKAAADGTTEAGVSPSG